MGLLTVAMTVLGQFMFEAVNGSALAARRMQAMLLAQEKMELIIANRSDLAAWEERALSENPMDGDVQGKARLFAEQDFEDYRWEWDFADPEDRPGMKQVTVRTYYEDPHGARPWVQCELSTLLLLPEQD